MECFTVRCCDTFNALVFVADKGTKSIYCEFKVWPLSLNLFVLSHIPPFSPSAFWHTKNFFLVSWQIKREPNARLLNASNIWFHSFFIISNKIRKNWGTKCCYLFNSNNYWHKWLWIEHLICLKTQCFNYTKLFINPENLFKPIVG